MDNLLKRLPALKRLGLGRDRDRGRITVIQQFTATECGVACLAMVLDYYGKPVGREAVRQVLGVGRDGATARHILNGARHFGLRARGVRIELDGLKCLKPASILHWNFTHFVVFERLTAGGVDIVDPEVGRRHVAMDEFSRSFTGIALALEPSDEFERSAGKKSTREGHILRLLGDSGEWGRVLATSIFVLVLTLALPLFTSAVVDRVVPRGDWHLLLILSLGLGALLVFHFVTTFVRAHLLLHLRTVFDVKMTTGLLDHMISLPFGFFQRRSSGDLLMRLNSSTFIQEILTSGVLSAVLDGGLMTFYAILLFAMSPTLGALVLLLGALQVGSFLALRARQRDVNAQMLVRQAQSQSYQIEMFAGIETLKAMGCEHVAEERWSNLFVDVLNSSLARGRLNTVLEAVQSTLRMATPLVLLGVGSYQVLDGKVSLGMMLALNTFANGVFTPLSSLVGMASQFQMLGIYLERIADIQEASPEQDRAKVRPSGALRGHIEVEQVSFRYGPLEPIVLKDVSVKIEPGHFVAIVGRTGSGKSTLASVLLGLYPPTSGRVLYDGVNLSDLALESVRRQLGIVTQQTHLFGGTIRSNIALADPELPLEAITEAAKLAQCHDEIAQMPMGYETVLSDGGGSISGGQRQRIAIARALVRKPSILLLDEATSALDAITELRVQEELAKLECTRVVIAHRLSTVVGADCILVMDEGRLVEQGTHAELLARGGLYAGLVGGQMASAA